MKSALSVLSISVWFCSLAGCETSKPREVSSNTITKAQIASAGVTPAELSEIQDFYKALRDGEGKRGYLVDSSIRKEDTELVRRALDAFGRPTAPKSILLTGKGGIKVGLLFDPASGRLGVTDPAKLSSYQVVSFERVHSDYRLTLVEGCVLYPLKVRMRGGRPLILSWSLPD